MQNAHSQQGFSGRVNRGISQGETGFSHGAYTYNTAVYTPFGTHRKNHISSIDTNTKHFPFSPTGETPGTAFNVNYTPLLPSDLLVNSPYQPGSPGNFSSPGPFGSPTLPDTNRFTQNINALRQQNQQYHHTQHMQLPSPVQNDAMPMSPTLFHNMMQADSFTPQSPPAFPGMGGTSYTHYQPMMNLNNNNAWSTTSSRTVYLGNIPNDASAEEILNHVRSGQVESVRLLPDKNCAFISFLDGCSATHFHSDAILKRLNIKGQDIKIGWGKPSQVSTSVALAVQQSGASRNVYLGNLAEDITEEEIKADLSKFGPIDTVKIVREKAIAFVHFLSISHAMKAVAQLPQDPKWALPKRVFYGKDRCAYVSKTQQQNAAQFLGIAPGYAHVLNGADRDLISNALAQQSVAAAAVATTAGGVNNLGNRTVYLGNIHPETTIEEICNVVRGGLLHHIRYIPDKHICFVTFIDPTSAASFYALSNLQGLMIHNRRLKVGWGKHSGALPPAIALAVSGGASRNVYIGNIDENWTEDRLRQDFSVYGEVELVNTLREKSCAFVNFTNIANAIKAIEAIRGKEEYKRFKINFGKDRCGNPPRQNLNGASNPQNRMLNGHNTASSLIMKDMDHELLQGGSSPTKTVMAPAGPRAGLLPVRQSANPLASTPSTILNAGSNNPLTMYLTHVSQQQQQQQAHAQREAQEDERMYAALQQHHNQALVDHQGGLYNDLPNGRAGYDHTSNHMRSSSHVPRQSSFGSTLGGAGVATNGASTTIGGFLAPTNTGLAQSRSAHSRAVSLPAFSQEVFAGPSNHNTTTSHRQFGGHVPQSSLSGFGSAFGTGYGTSGYNGLGLTSDLRGGLTGWAEEEVVSR